MTYATAKIIGYDDDTFEPVWHEVNAMCRGGEIEWQPEAWMPIPRYKAKGNASPKDSV